MKRQGVWMQPLLGPAAAAAMRASAGVCLSSQVGQRQTVKHEEYYCHAFNRDGLVGIAFVDKDYPARAGFCVVNQIIEDYLASVGEGWRGVTADREDSNAQLEAAVQKYQVGAGARMRVWWFWEGCCARLLLGRADGGAIQSGGERGAGVRE